MGNWLLSPWLIVPGLKYSYYCNMQRLRLANQPATSQLPPSEKVFSGWICGVKRGLGTWLKAQFRDNYMLKKNGIVNRCIINEWMWALIPEERQSGVLSVKKRWLTVKVATSSPVSTSHNMAVESMLPVATSVLWGLNARHTYTTHSYLLHFLGIKPW